ncbi:MAG: hypothetical protein GY737_05450 [Desulfobacteraceae bacterium]|nr:hypothetical protein [Desulfobacteraceae bacterium]
MFAHDLISHLDNNTIDIKAALQVLSEKIELELQQSGLDLNKALNSLRLYNECVRALAQHMFGCTAEVRKVAGTLKEVSATLSQTNEVISKLASGEERAKEQHDTLVFSLGELTAAVKELVQQVEHKLLFSFSVLEMLLIQ